MTSWDLEKVSEQKKVGIFNNKVFPLLQHNLGKSFLKFPLLSPPHLTTHTNKQTLHTSARHWQNRTLSWDYAITVNGPQYKTARNNNSGTQSKCMHGNLKAYEPLPFTVLVPVVTVAAEVMTVVAVVVVVVAVVLLLLVVLVCTGFWMAIANAPFFNAFCLCLLPADNSHIQTSQNERTFIQNCLFVFICIVAPCILI